MMESVLFQAAKLWNPDRPAAKNLSAFVNEEEPATHGILEFVEMVEKNHAPQWILNYNEQVDTDGKCVLSISSDALTAWMMVLPPIGSGAPVSPGDISQLLHEQAVCSGVDAIACIEACNQNFTAFTVAKGRKPVDGVDGKVEELFSRMVKHSVRIGENDTVDYRDLGWLQTVKLGDVICTITYPTDGVPGETVTGKPIPAKNGVMPRIPAGDNLKYSADKTKLLAACEGRVVFRDDNFCIDTQLVINSDVDGNVGNISMPGDVIIKGSVLSGFSVFAKGNITISGIVENAHVCALGDITISNGVKGDGNSLIESSKNIDCRFVENATLRAKGSIHAEYIVNSDISAFQDVIITRGKATLIGGSVRVGRKISAKTIGNAVNRPITISMGMDPEVLEQMQENKHEIAQLEQKIAQADKNIAFLQDQSSLDAQYTKLLHQLKFRRSIDSMHMTKLQKAVDKAMQEYDPLACEIEADTFYPPASIHIGTSSYALQKVWQKHKIVFRDGDISVIPN